MASSSAPRILTFKADAALAKGKAVKFGTDADHVAVGAANTDRVFGIVQNASTAAEDDLEVALPGGGAKALIGETILAGEYLVCHTDGTLVKPNAEGDVIIAQAMEGGVANDLISVEVLILTAHAAI